MSTMPKQSGGDIEKLGQVIWIEVPVQAIYVYMLVRETIIWLELQD